MLFFGILIIAAGVFIFSGIKLITIFSGYKKGSNAYEEIESISRRDPVKPTSDQVDQPEEVYFDVSALKEVNGDAKGYLYGADVLSYPIVQGTDII